MSGGQRDRKATIRDVAALAGVSPSAVTIALHDRPGVSATTRERVLRAAQELDWRPNQFAAALSGHTVHTVGLAIARPARLLGVEPFYAEFIAGIESVLSPRGCSLLLRVVEDEGEIQAHTEWWRARRINGSILVDLKPDDPRIPALSAIGLPAVVAGHPSLAGPFTSIWTDDAAAMAEAVRYLAALGHRRLGRISGPADLGHAAIRTKAFDEITASLGVQGRTAVTDYTPELDSRAARTLLLAPDRPTAIIVDGDLIAIAALKVADEFGLSVPADLSLLSWDDSQLSQLTRPALSAMSHDVSAYGADVATALLDVMAGREHPSHPTQLPRLLPRASTSPPR